MLLQQFGWLIPKKRNLVGFLEALACCAVLFSQCNLANATTVRKGHKEKARSEGKYLHIKAATYLVGYQDVDM